MTVRILQLIFGVVIYLCSTPVGMAKEYIPEDARADFLIDGQKQDFQEMALYLFDEATMGEMEVMEVSESETESENESKRQKRRSPVKKFSPNKCRMIPGLSVERMSKGVARHPGTQDAQQERTATIRYLQTAALIS